MARIMLLILLQFIIIYSTSLDASNQWIDVRVKNFTRTDDNTAKPPLEITSTMPATQPTISPTIPTTAATQTSPQASSTLSTTPTTQPISSPTTPAIQTTPTLTTAATQTTPPTPITATTQTTPSITPTTPPVPLESYCQTAGYQCAGCHQVIVCYKEDGLWNAIMDDTCSDPQTCDEGYCTDIPNRECSQASYKCRETEGMYPDPSSCQNFKYCVPQKDTVELKMFSSSCDLGYAYNARTTYCDKPLPNNTCNGYPVPECTEPAQTAALLENPTIYYICLPINLGSNFLYPYLDACKNGKTYDASTSICV